VADLARWQDWSVVDRLVGIFKDATADNIFVREPIVNYLRACPLPAAAAAVKELEKIDPEAVRRAATLAGLAGLTAATPGAPGAAGAAATGEPDAPPSEPPATDAASGGLAARIPTVIAEGEAEMVAAAPVAPPAARPAAASDRDAAPPGWKWALWAAAVLVIAVLARLFLRPGGSAGTAAR
jgi:hypothetical protein